jgi:GNAT superfamily N-acetyltransferase
MLFASVELASRIERADCRLLTDSAEAIRKRNREAEVLVMPIAGGVAAFTGVGSPLTKVAGLGFAGAVDEKELGTIEQAWAHRGAEVQVELSCLAEPSIGKMLTHRGYELRGFENVLGRSLTAAEDAKPTAPAIDIRVSGTDEFSSWLDVVVTGFATPDQQGVPSHETFPRELLERIIGDMAEAGGLIRYLARVDGAPAGGASMKISDGVAQMCGAATLPAFRRQGVQTALLWTRLESAGRSGADVATVTTLPGSKSQENVQKKGFELLYTRAILVKPAPTISV